MNAVRKTSYLVLAFGLLTASVAGCGKKGQGANSPGGSSMKLGEPGGLKAGKGKSGAVATNDAGAQVGVVDKHASNMNSSASGAYQRGLQAWAAGDLNGAKSAFAEAGKSDPKAFQAFYSLGVIQERMGDPAALESFRKAYTVKADYEPALVAYAMLLAKGGNISEADNFLTNLRGKLPKNPAILSAAAEVKSLKGDTGTAQHLAREALKADPDYRPAMVVLARDHYRARHIDLSLYALRAILDGEGEANPPRDKNNADAHLLRAIIYKEKGLRGPAIDAFEKCVKLRPDFVDARVQLAAYLLQSGNAAKALPHLDSALKYQSENLLAHLNRGDALRLLGRSDDAKKEFDWVIKKDSSYPAVHYNLGLLYLFSDKIGGLNDKQRYTKAVSALEKFKQVRGKPVAGTHDDSEQLLMRAKVKLVAIKAQEAAAKAQAKAAAAAKNPPPPPPAASAPPAGSGAPPPAASGGKP